MAIDESPILFKGRLIFKQYIKTERAGFGIKLFVIADCETGYVLEFMVYTEKDSKIKKIDSLGHTGSLFIQRLLSYLGKRHSLFTDNFYSSPTVSTYL